jgi:hypothetical protein
MLLRDTCKALKPQQTAPISSSMSLAKYLNLPLREGT